MSEYISVREVADMFGVSSTTIRKILVAEKVPVLILQRKWRVRRDDAIALFDEHFVVFEDAEEVDADEVV